MSHFQLNKDLPNHPDIVRMETDGFIENPFAGTDYFGDEIHVGDPIVEIEGEVILGSNLELYLINVLFAEFKYAE
ncbi:hypothetical protein BTO30_15030 [Domibacillus antri]|uniref:Uncharacterized protein n=1 Tax=Domibacillus antri TaxID=1714264 RepID=A0A1Q8Q293_9BACI|nr:hypothetical protein [Domibacillus antri]OLN21428.1 hypothetical protein BTO30_15030 [Domibacillus antri]